VGASAQLPEQFAERLPLLPVCFVLPTNASADGVAMFVEATDLAAQPCCGSGVIPTAK
jgi:hypothetical protein